MQYIAKKLKDNDPRIHQLIIPTIMPTTNHATVGWRRGSLQLHYHTYRSISKYTLFLATYPFIILHVEPYKCGLFLACLGIKSVV